MKMNLIVRELKNVGFLLVFSISTAFLYNFYSPFGIAVFGQWKTSKEVVNAVAKNNTFDFAIEINHPAIVQQIVEKKERMILDVRLKDFYDTGHIPGALSYPLIDFDKNLSRLLDLTEKDTAILVYCSGMECTDSHTFAKRLIELNYTDVKVFAGGFRQWVDTGFEIEKNE